VEALCRYARVQQVFVVLAPGDPHFRQHDWSVFHGKLATLYCGGATRAASVINGLTAMADVAELDDWVLVHDAARPMLQAAWIDRLLAEISPDDTGGLLALPVADTLKRADETQHVSATVPRDKLWQAQTPQMFRYGVLLEALHRALRVNPASVTDEASAVEQLGLTPRLVMGSPLNLKVTWPEDWRFIENCLKSNIYE
jgi:2-C-methyl-D-erythritol 4-phosphate cytidylyltransferase